MTKDKAIEAARAEAIKNELEMAVVFDPISREDWETEDEAYGYCPLPAFGTVYRWGTLIATISPQGRSQGNDRSGKAVA